MRSDLQIVDTFARKPRVFYDREARSWAVHSAHLVQYHSGDRERALRVAESIARVRQDRADAWAYMADRLKRGPIRIGSVLDMRPPRDLGHFNCAGRYVMGVDLASGPDTTVEGFRTHDGNIIVTKIAVSDFKAGDPVQVGGHFAINPLDRATRDSIKRLEFGTKPGVSSRVRRTR